MKQITQSRQSNNLLTKIVKMLVKIQLVITHDTVIMNQSGVLKKI